jgi:gas vesicle protein
MSPQMKKAVGYIGVALGAGAAGAALGILLAPAAGRETRRRILRRAQEEREALVRRSRRAVENALNRAADRLEEGKRKVEEGKRKLEAMLPTCEPSAAAPRADGGASH